MPNFDVFFDVSKANASVLLLAFF